MRYDAFLAEAARIGQIATPAARRRALAMLEGNEPPTPRQQTTATPPRALTLAASARSSGWSTMTLRRAIGRGDLRTVKPTGGRPRILESDLAAWMEGRS